MKRSFASKKRDKIIDDLRKWNQDLRNCLERSEVPAQDNSRVVQELRNRFNRKKCDSIRSCLRSFHRALGSGLNCGCLSSHEATIDLDWDSEQSGSALWVFTAGLSYETIPGSPSSMRSWRKFRVTAEKAETAELEAAKVSVLKSTITTSSPSRAERNPVSRFFSNMRQTPARARPTAPATGKPRPIVPDRHRVLGSSVIQSVSFPVLVAPTEPPTPPATSIGSLCAEVRRQCTSWSIIGSLRDPDLHEEAQISRFSLGNPPKESSDSAETISLKFLLSRQNWLSQQLHPHLALSAKQRYGIAASAAWSVLCLSGSPWLGERWDKDQMKFFLEKTTAGRELLSQHPCASYMFPGSKAVCPVQSSETDAFNYLIPNRTIFTLGIILIELCLNTPFEELRQNWDRLRGENTATATLLDDCEIALSNLDQVYREAGDSYGYAVERCIKFSFSGRETTKTFDFGQFRQQFYDAVVAPVQARYLRTPDSRGYL